MSAAASPALTMGNAVDLARAQFNSSKLEAGLTRTGQSPDTIRQVAEDFESVFVTSLLESMFAGIKTDGPFGGGHGESVYRSMLNEQYANAIVRNGGIGIADSIAHEILKLQEAAPPVTEPPGTELK